MTSIITLNHVDTCPSHLESFLKYRFERQDPFNTLLKQFCETLSTHLFQQNDIKEYPDFVALAFWLRNAHLLQLQKDFDSKQSKNILRSPIGCVFHIPPANIDVMFVYSWITSLLLGNSNIIRLPSNLTARFQKLLQLIDQVLSDKAYTSLKNTTCFVQYGHDDAITAWISSHIDMRIIWGGDETVAHIRKIPLPATAKEIAFPDRFSYAAIKAEIFLQADTDKKKRCVNDFYNDVYWFDQSACSSPRLIFWIGTPNHIQEASQFFYNHLQEILETKHHEISVGGTLLKKTYLYNQALELPATSVTQFSNELSVLFLSAPVPNCRVHCGQGLIYHVPLATIDGIVPFVNAHDQTLIHFGFSHKELTLLAMKLNGKGLSRFVPAGQALAFEPVWDGQDLFIELTHPLTIRE